MQHYINTNVVPAPAESEAGTCLRAVTACSAFLGEAVYHDQPAANALERLLHLSGPTAERQTNLCVLRVILNYADSRIRGSDWQMEFVKGKRRHPVGAGPGEGMQSARIACLFKPPYVKSPFAEASWLSGSGLIVVKTCKVADPSVWNCLHPCRA